MTNAAQSATPRKLVHAGAVKRKSAAKQLPAMPRPGGKLGVIIDRVSEATGATVDELVSETGWQRHSVLGALSRLRARGYVVHLATNGERRAYKLDIAVGVR